MAKFLSETGLTTLWGRIDSLFVRKSAVSSAGATIGTSDTTIATIGGVDIKAKIGTYLTSSNLTNHAKLADTSTVGQALVSKSGGYEWKTLGSNAYNSTAFLTTHQTIKQDGITGATVTRFGTCSTAAATAAKTVSVTAGTVALEAGLKVTVKFSNANTANSPTLNVNSKGAKNIFHKGAQITSGANKALLAGTVDFVYDGTQWQLIGNYIDSNSGGTVTSVGMTVPTGLSVSGSPITGSGTLAVTYASGYSIPTTTKQSNWDTAYGWGNHSGLYLPLSGGNVTGAINLYAASGDSPALIFRRGTLTDSLDDWKIYDTAGALKFQHTIGSTTNWQDYVVFSATAGTVTINGNTALHAGNYNSSTYADTTPTSGSTKLIRSGAVYTAITEIEDTVAASESALNTRLTTLEGLNIVTGTGLTADKIVLGNGTRTVKTSSKGISTAAPTSSSDDTTVPTSKAVWDSLSVKMETIKGTQSSSTNAWTGVSKLASSSALTDGYSFVYWLPYAGTSTAATLTLTFANNSTKTMNVYVKGTTRMTTHYGAGSSMVLTYYAAANVGGTSYEGVWAQPYYYSTDGNYNVGEYYARYFIYNTSNPLYRYKIFGLKQGKVVPLSITDQTSGTIVSKTPTSLSFEIERGLYYYTSTTTVSATGDAVAAQTTYSHWGAMSTPHYTFNTEVPVYSDVYLVGSLSDDGTEFKLDTTSNTSWYVYIYRGGGTPAASNGSFVIGKYYMFVGRSYSSANYMSLEYHNPVYYCRDLLQGGTLIPWDRLEGGTAIGSKSHSEGYSTAYTAYSHAEGDHTHAGKDTDPWNGVSQAAYPQHMEGDEDYIGAHSEGSYTWAKLDGSHAEGIGTKALGAGSHAEGIGPSASSDCSHAEGYCTNATNDSEHAEGRYNYSHTSYSNDAQSTIHSVGIGTSSTRKNAVEIMKNGDMYIYGVGGYTGSNISTASTLQTILSSSSDPDAITNSEIDTILAS